MVVFFLFVYIFSPPYGQMACFTTFLSTMAAWRLGYCTVNALAQDSAWHRNVWRYEQVGHCLISLALACHHGIIILSLSSFLSLAIPGGNILLRQLSRSASLVVFVVVIACT
jgi:hypothetical protein